MVHSNARRARCSAGMPVTSRRAGRVPKEVTAFEIVTVQRPERRGGHFLDLVHAEPAQLLEGLARSPW